MPPKTWKKTLPSQGQWSFTLNLGPRKIDSGDTGAKSNNGNGGIDGDQQNQGEGQPSPADGIRNSNSSSSSREPRGNDINHGDSNQSEQDKNASSVERSGQPPKPNSSVVDGVAVANNTQDNQQRQQGEEEEEQPLVDTPSPTTKLDIVVEAPKVVVPIRPDRALCLEVAQKYLSWEFTASDFCVPEGGMGTRGDETVEEVRHAFNGWNS